MRIEGASPENQILVQANGQTGEGSLLRRKSGSKLNEDHKSPESNSKKTTPGINTKLRGAEGVD